MANKLLVKRSATPSKVPATTDLDLGEIGINTYDGKMYIKKDAGTPTVIEIGASAGGTPSIVTGNVSGVLPTILSDGINGLGTNIGATGQICIGENSRASGCKTIVIGTNNRTNFWNGGPNDLISIGSDMIYDTSYPTVRSILIGNGIKCTNAESILIGLRAKADGASNYRSNCIGIGTDVNVSGSTAIGIGLSVTSGHPGYAGGTLAIGNGANAGCTDSICLGGYSQSSNSGSQGTIALGVSASTTSSGSYYAISIGRWSSCFSTRGISIGTLTVIHASASSAIAIGDTASCNAASATYAIALGNSSTATATSTVSIGYSSSASASYGIALGSGTVASGSQAIAIGGGGSSSSSATAGAQSAIAIGNAVNITATYAIGIGQSTLCHTSATSSISIGNGATCNSNSSADAIAIGTGANGTGDSGVAIGAYSKTILGGVALGSNAQCTGGGTNIAIGHSSVSSSFSSIAIGDTASIVTNCASAIAIGDHAIAGIRGQFAFGRDDQIGTSSRTSFLRLVAQTTDEIQKELSTANSSTPAYQITLQLNSMNNFTINLVGKKSGASDAISYQMVGCVKVGATKGSIAIIGTPTITLLGATAGASTWSATVNVDTTTGALTPRVTGQAATTIDWFAQVNLIELAF